MRIAGVEGPKQLRVRAAVAGRDVVAPEAVLTAPGRRVAVITREAVVVPNCRFVRKRIEKGDLVIVEEQE